ncbi:mechanosensitive ion channel family protein [Actinotalea sp.]|uniref:mechanosensitive ion channel family protein n=1 Tax=Actinotalea sp. TaxID=1872145 RepID=UPI003561BD09
MTAAPLVPFAVPALTDSEAGAAVVSGVALVLGVAGALIVALLLAEVISAVVRVLGRGTWLAENLSRRARRPLRIVLVVVLVWLAIRLVTPGGEDAPGWRAGVEHALLILLILSGAWLLGALLFVVEDATLARYSLDSPDNSRARRVRTQVMILRRVTVAVLVLCALAGALLTFPAARVAGAGLLASAGLVSVVAGLAAQSSLANIFAGLQLAFTDAIRVDDVVVVDGQWGRIEEITLTYVVVHAWDDRRLILPSTWFTTTPFENWTRRAADLLGTVELDLDWSVPVPAMRAELVRLLEDSELWDHRVGVLQVTEATGGWVRVRALASAVDAPTLFDLRCTVREGLVAWLQREHPGALPRTRYQAIGAGAEPESTGEAATSEGSAGEAQPTTASRRPVPRGAVGEETALLDQGKDSRLFTGSLAAVERSRLFGGPGRDVIAEREATAHGQPTTPTPVAPTDEAKGPGTRPNP